MNNKAVVIMRLALQALFSAHDVNTEEGWKRRERIERNLRNNERSRRFLKKLNDVVFDPCLRAPEIFAEESFPDVNIVAEYLDCQSESEEVCEEYERVCFENPEILAEVGCCYDVLKNRLGRPINSLKNCRRRLYYVAWEEDARTKLEQALEDVENGQSITIESSTSKKVPVQKIEQKLAKTESGKSADTYESDVQRIMRTERSLGRRAARLAGRTILAASLLFGAFYGVSQWAGESGSESFDIAGNQEQRDETLGETGELAATTGSTEIANGGFPAADQNDDDLLVASDFITDETGSYAEDNLNNYDDVLYMANQYEVVEVGRASAKRISNDRYVQEEQAPSEDGGGLYANSGVARPPRARRGGLGAPDMERSKAIVIPDQNNDVFSKTMRF